MKLIKFRTVDQSVTAIADKPGRLYTMMVFIDAPLRLHKVPNGDVARYGSELDKPPLKKAARTMLKAGKTLGITKGAKKLLRSAVSS